MNNTKVGEDIDKRVNHTFTIEIMKELTEDELQYIFDCWCEFWCGDFGYLPNEYTMILH